MEQALSFKLTRTDYLSNGIFGKLQTFGEDPTFQCYTLEHSYESDANTFTPKLPVGSYKCVRGEHHLHGWIRPLVRFEVTDVPDHSGILIHMGNYNADSEGCVLVGSARDATGIHQSKEAYAQFEKVLEGINEFNLTVE